MDFSSRLMLKATILLVLISLRCIFLGVESATLSLSTDKESLISFKSKISPEPPNPLSSWDLNTYPCNWTGVVCNKSGLRVIGLNLSGFGLKDQSALILAISPSSIPSNSKITDSMECFPLKLVNFFV